jgi:WD40 repeat protein
MAGWDSEAGGPHAPAGARELRECLAPPQAPDEIGRLGPYRVLKVLGSGGMGVVYQAEDVQLRRPVALKALLPALAAAPTFRERFLREARAAAAIKHDHVVTIYQVGEDRGVPFLAMEFLEGESLDQRLRRAGPLSAAEARQVGREMADGLAAAHDRGLVHRDIKPGNVWLETQPGSAVTGGRVKILDFGLARAVDDATHLTQQGAVVGTPAFMAPEQAAGQPVDARCDLFSLGCVLYNALAGHPPFKGLDMIATLLAVATQDPPTPRALNPRVPVRFSDLVMRLLAKKPADRPASAREVIKALDALAVERTAEPTAVPSRKTATAVRRGASSRRIAPRRRRLGWGVLAVGGAVLLSALAGGLAFLLSADTGGEPAHKDEQQAGQKVNGGQQGEPKGPGGPAGPPVGNASPSDALAPQEVPAEKRAALGGGDPKRVSPDLVAVLEDNVSCLTFHPDGKTLVYGSGPDLKVWDIAARKVVGTFPPLGRKNILVLGLRFSRDGRRLITLGGDGWLRLWDVPTRRRLRSFRGRLTDFWRAAFSPDGKRLAISNAVGRAGLWDLEPLTKLPALDKFEGTAGPLAFSPDGKILALALRGAGQPAVRLWDMVRGQALRTLPTPGDTVRGIDFTSDGKKLVTNHVPEGAIRVWDAERGTLLRAFRGRQMRLSPDRETIAIPMRTRVGIWDLDEGWQIAAHELGAPANRIVRLAYSPEGRHLAAVLRSGTAAILRLARPGAKVKAAAAAGEWEELFNGKDLQGWKPANASARNLWVAASDVHVGGKQGYRLTVTPGTGLLVNARGGRGGNLVSQAEYGDCELHVEFLIPPKSNSGVYLMGRYELQIFDSFLKPDHRLNANDSGSVFGVRAPAVNASRPPGEWQTFDVLFQAPRFSAGGQKIAPARFVKVVYNGQAIHMDVSVPGPTDRAVDRQETATGRVMLQGDHGPVAFRNLRLKRRGPF